MPIRERIARQLPEVRLKQDLFRTRYPDGIGIGAKRNAILGVDSETMLGEDFRPPRQNFLRFVR